MQMEIDCRKRDAVVITYTSGSDELVLKLPQVASVEVETPTEKKPLVMLAS